VLCGGGGHLWWSSREEFKFRMKNCLFVRGGAVMQLMGRAI